MKKEKILKILLLIRNILFAMATLYLMFLSLTLIIDSYTDKAQELKYALKMILGYFLLIVGIIATAFSSFYLVVSVKALRNLKSKTYHVVIIITETVLTCFLGSLFINLLLSLNVAMLIVMVLMIHCLVNIIWFSKDIKNAKK